MTTNGMWTFSRAVGFTMLVGVAVGVSAVLYTKSRSADFDRHADVIQSLGEVRHLDELLSEDVIAARFGLLNQYDPITSAELALTDAASSLRERTARTVTLDAALVAGLRELDLAIERRRVTVEHFKAENSILKNSLRYLPTAADGLVLTLAGIPQEKGGSLIGAVHRLVQATLVYTLIGDQTTRAAYVQRLQDLKALAPGAPPSVTTELGLVLAHADVVAARQSSVDGWVRSALERDVSTRLGTVEAAYYDAFGGTVSASNRYRRILYGWSLLLVVAVAIAGAQLRRVYAGLEQLVLARTAELRKALDALWGEMKLARKIQEALVPRAPLLRGSEVAAIMKPTEEVGGDYYDVIHGEQSEWILVGDVSGHGVPAGLVMMMCHTAVRTALECHPDLMPDRLLAVVNRVLTENIRQLGEDKYMSITAFRFEPDGTVHHAGAHQDVLIYRAGSATVEVIETHGMWLGLMPRIDRALTAQSFRLGAGDVLLLHTDGITEATRDGALFDVHGVQGVLARAAGKNAEQVLGELFTAIETFRVTDDATAVVVRKLEDAPPVAKAG
jgi:serine phosphatase RsbU (regulator of sigma subunit)